MAKTLLSTYIYIDTSIFESENFLEGNKLKQLFDLAANGHVQLLIPNIVHQEILARMKRHLHNAKKYVDMQAKDYSQNLRILRNIPFHQVKFGLPAIHVKKDIESLSKALDDLFKTGKTIFTGNDKVSVDKVMEKYFTEEYPFHGTDKKHEFPDAFALASIEQYCTNLNITSCREPH